MDPSRDSRHITSRLVIKFSLTYKISPAYTQTVKKEVLVNQYILLQRNLLCSGVSRGKKFVNIVSTKKAKPIAVRNNKTQSDIAC